MALLAKNFSDVSRSPKVVTGVPVSMVVWPNGGVLIYQQISALICFDACANCAADETQQDPTVLLMLKVALSR